MLNKWLMLGGIVLVSLVYGSKVQAEAICPEGYYTIGGGNAGWIGCAQIDGYQFPQSNPNPRPRPSSGTSTVPDFKKEYGDSYIAVAWHPKATDVWASWNQRTNRKATQTALNACTKAMGEGCGLVLNGWNGSAVFVRDRTNTLRKGWGNTPQQAREFALRSCQSASQGCEVVHTFVSEPLKQPNNFKDILEYSTFLDNPTFDVSKSYFPGNRGFFAIAWLGGKQEVALTNLVVASGFPTLKDAEQAALDRCQVQSKQTCLSLKDVDDRINPLFGIYLNSRNIVQIYNHTTTEGIERSAAAECSKLGLTCQKVGIFDVTRSNVSIHRIKKL